MKKIATLLVLAFLAASSHFTVAQSAVEVDLKLGGTIKNMQLVGVMNRNLESVLNEINRAHEAKRPLELDGLPMNEFSKNTLRMLWANVYFFCDEEYIAPKLWCFSKSYMVREVPVIISPMGENFGTGVFQQAVVEFDQKGFITDFCFALDAEVGESMQQGGDPVDIEHRVTILKWCDRFRTAYNTKDMSFLQQVFSDDAIIITGHVYKTRKNDQEKFKVVNKKQTKQEYLSNLQKSFDNNKWINVKFTCIGEHDGVSQEQAVTRSAVNPNFYGVRLRQKWNSSSYNDEGYVFLLWDFTDPNAPVIHVRSWQPNLIDSDDILSMSDFEY